MTTQTDDLTTALEAIQEAVERFNVAMKGHDIWDVDDALPVPDALWVLRGLTADGGPIDVLRKLASRLETHIHAKSTPGEAEYEGIGLVRVGRRHERKAWDHEGWKSATRAALIEKRGITGELVDSASGEFIDVWSLLEEAMSIQGSGAPKITALRGLSIDPDDFCHSERGTIYVDFLS